MDGQLDWRRHHHATRDARGGWRDKGQRAAPDHGEWVAQGSRAPRRRGEQRIAAPGPFYSQVTERRNAIDRAHRRGPEEGGAGGVVAQRERHRIRGARDRIAGRILHRNLHRR